MLPRKTHLKTQTLLNFPIHSHISSEMVRIAVTECTSYVSLSVLHC